MTTKRSPALVEALSKCIMHQPFFAVLLMDLLTVKETDGLPTAGTDGKNLYINPEFFSGLTVDERVFILSHEVLHVILDHPARTKLYVARGIGPDFKKFSPKKMNVAEDYIINDWLIQSGQSDMPHGGLHNPQYGMDWIADELYCKLPDEEEENDDGNWDEHLEGCDDAQAPTKADIQTALKQAEAAAKARGNMPAHLERLVDSMCEPQVVWHEELQLNVSTAAGRDDSTWARPNRKRLAVSNVYLPGTCAHRAGRIVVFGDTSGSVTEKEWSHYMGEMASICEDMNPEELWVGSCDTQTYGPHLIDDVETLREYRPEGGGGTHMPAIFDTLKEEGIVPDCLVILTDMYTDFGDDPGYQVIWVATSDIVAPFGKTIQINVTGE